MNTQTKAGRTKTAKARKALTPNQLFFYEHAGYAYKPETETAEQGRIRCAIEMAQDEEKVTAMSSWHYEWSDDWEIDDSWMTEEEKAQDHTWEVCQLLDENDHVLASCGGIVDADPNYRRVMEAELAGEALSIRFSGFDDVPRTL